MIIINIRLRKYQADPNSTVVCRPCFCDSDIRRSPIRLHFHRDVLHFHRILVVQILLCLRIHASCVRYLDNGYDMHDHCSCLLYPQLGELPLAVDCFCVGRINSWIRIPLLSLLFYLQNTDDWTAASRVLLRIHVS